MIELIECNFLFTFKVFLMSMFVFWLCSMAATLFVQPLDLVKNRMQMSGEYIHVLNSESSAFIYLFIYLFIFYWKTVSCGYKIFQRRRVWNIVQ